MAGYIEWSKGLAEKREVLIMASKLHRNPHEIAGRLMLFWEWCDDNVPEESIDKDTGDAVIILSPIRGDTEMFIDAKCGLKGMAKALAIEGVEWIKHERNGRVRLPHFGRHNGATAKTRARNARNQANRRGKTVTDPSPSPSPFAGDKKVTNQPNPTHVVNGSFVRSFVDMEGGAGGNETPSVEFACLDAFCEGHLSQVESLCAFHRAASEERPEAIAPNEQGLLTIIAVAVHAIREGKESKLGLFSYMVRHLDTIKLNGDDRRRAGSILKAHRAEIASGKQFRTSAIPICDSQPEEKS